MNWKLIAACVFVLIVVLHVRDAQRPPDGTSIVQTTLGDFSFAVLREKQPVIIQDPIADLRAVCRAWFNGNIVTDLTVSPGAWNRNRYKYAVLHPTSDAEVLISPSLGPPTPESPVVAVQLKASQLLVLPAKWWYVVSGQVQTTAVGVHDYLTRLIL